MTEKKYTISELNEMTNKLWLQYVTLFREDKMSFQEYILIENMIMKVQHLFDVGMEAFE